MHLLNQCKLNCFGTQEQTQEIRFYVSGSKASADEFQQTVKITVAWKISCTGFGCHNEGGPCVTPDKRL